MLRRLTPTFRGSVRALTSSVSQPLTAPSKSNPCKSSKAATTAKLNKLQPTIIELNKDHLHLAVFTERTLFYRNWINNNSLHLFFYVFFLLDSYGMLAAHTMPCPGSGVLPDAFKVGSVNLGGLAVFCSAGNSRWASLPLCGPRRPCVF